ncbi:hypothetical protein [Paludisphaera soli]|uniref:hypothetical protein n=1 Tax=Paludisphaera soli TaxID=2712865 RepID=UPI0013EBF376|nr:hypothetical protein [Paludisphaera soli]
MTATRPTVAIALGVFGVAYGSFLAASAFVLGGGGHGWCSPILSSIGVFLVPAFGVALAYPPERRRPMIKMIAAVVILTDLLLVIASWQEGASYIAKVWSTIPRLVVIWAILWASWQLALLAVLVLDASRPARLGSRSEAT